MKRQVITTPGAPTPMAHNCQGVLESYGFTLLDDGTGCFTSTSLTTIGFISPDTFGGLQDNGGPTMTVALLSGSQAINAAPATQPCIDENGTSLSTDQRGGARVVGPRCDVGAFELGAAADRIFSSTFE